mmetsp:Transcript_32580/g.108724  ORF Transcript_32580/g.108724 Transcript_32580/m.108724 type:complete len:251 (-) Transcript_32580:821-1573(-)
MPRPRQQPTRRRACSCRASSCPSSRTPLGAEVGRTPQCGRCIRRSASGGPAMYMPRRKIHDYVYVDVRKTRARPAPPAYSQYARSLPHVGVCVSGRQRRRQRAGGVVGHRWRGTWGRRAALRPCTVLRVLVRVQSPRMPPRRPRVHSAARVQSRDSFAPSAPQRRKRCPPSTPRPPLRASRYRRPRHARLCAPARLQPGLKRRPPSALASGVGATMCCGAGRDRRRRVLASRSRLAARRRGRPPRSGRRK